MVERKYLPPAWYSCQDRTSTRSEDTQNSIRLSTAPSVARAWMSYIGGAEVLQPGPPLGQPQRAIEDYDEAARLNTRDVDAFANRALVYTLTGRDAEAHQDFDRAAELEVDPTLLTQAFEKMKSQR